MYPDVRVPSTRYPARTAHFTRRGTLAFTHLASWPSKVPFWASWRAVRTRWRAPSSSHHCCVWSACSLNAFRRPSVSSSPSAWQQQRRGKGRSLSPAAGFHLIICRTGKYSVNNADLLRVLGSSVVSTSMSHYRPVGGVCGEQISSVWVVVAIAAPGR